MSEYYARNTALQAFQFTGDAKEFAKNLERAGFSKLITVQEHVGAPSPRISVFDNRFNQTRRPDGPVKIDMYSGIWLVVPRSDYVMGFNDATFRMNYVAPSSTRVTGPVSAALLSETAVSSADMLKGATRL